MPPRRFSTLLLVQISFLANCLGRTLNVTIDDTRGDELSGTVPTYSGGSNSRPWHARSDVDGCGECLVNPDPSQVHLQTWHDGSCNPCTPEQTSSVNMTFTGTAIYIYGIVSNHIDGAVTDTHVSFYIDGELVGAYDHTAQISNTIFEYNQLLYFNATLDNVGHDVLIASSPSIGGSLILFDYAMYTSQFDDPKTTSTESTRDNAGTTASNNHAPSESTPSATDLPQPTRIPSHISKGVKIGVGIAAAAVSLCILTSLGCFCARRRKAAQEARLTSRAPGAATAYYGAPALPNQITAFHKHAGGASLARGPPKASPAAAEPQQLLSRPQNVPASFAEVVAPEMELREEVVRLRDEVHRLRANELEGHAPPPVYDALDPSNARPLS